MNENGHEAPEPEPDAIPAGKTTLVVVVSALVCGLAVLSAAWLYGLDFRAAGSAAPARRGAVQVPPRAPGGLEQTLVEHAASGVTARKSELEELNSYGWIDRARGVYAIPIDRAMEIFASRGGDR
jgi:hypothetical protein